jgi:hypothetical protein
MPVRTKLALAGLTAALLLGFTVSPVSARSLSLSRQHFRITWVRLKFFDQEGVVFTDCPVTMEGSFHSQTINKVVDSLIGFITRAVVFEARCTQETSARFLASSLPWHIKYKAFGGTLPRIASVRVLIRGIAYESSIRGVPCLFVENGTNSISGEFFLEPTGIVLGFAFDPSTRIAVRPGGICLIPEAGLERTGEVFVLNTTTRITIRLI